MMLMEVIPPLIVAIGFVVKSFELSRRRDTAPTEMLRRDSVEAICVDWYGFSMNSITEREITNGGEW